MINWSDFSCYLLLPSRWLLARALPGANRLIKHLHNQKVPFALASNSMTKNVEAKVSHQPGLYSFFVTSSFGHYGLVILVMSVLVQLNLPCIYKFMNLFYGIHTVTYM